SDGEPTLTPFRHSRRIPLRVSADAGHHDSGEQVMTRHQSFAGSFVGYRRRAAMSIAAAGVLAAASITFVGTESAQAFPRNCSQGISGNTGYIVCYGGSGQYRARVSCDVFLGFDYKR